MTTAVENLDVAEMRDQHDPDTPLFNELMAEYDADLIDGLGQGWPPVMTAPEEEPETGDDHPDEPGTGEPSEPEEAGTGEAPGDTSEPVPDPAPQSAG